MTKNFAETLKELRINAGYSQKQVYEMFNIRQSTFSAWETGRAEPSADMLLKLCQLYKVTDIFTAFGYDGYNEDGSIKLNLKEQELIKKYRTLDPFGQETVTIAVGRESDRTEQIAALENHSFELLNAAHQNPGATSEDLQYDNDIMDDDSEWE
ncbi:MAG: helix-turn-helix transcriptional regulator [Lachnospiraceae bacterium]|nr:helix-turn-helix transcriptional regulator [Lachnospiraceae bacterium]